MIELFIINGKVLRTIILDHHFRLVQAVRRAFIKFVIYVSGKAKNFVEGAWVCFFNALVLVSGIIEIIFILIALNRGAEGAAKFVVVFLGLVVAISVEANILLISKIIIHLVDHDLTLGITLMVLIASMIVATRFILKILSSMKLIKFCDTSISAVHLSGWSSTLSS